MLEIQLRQTVASYQLDMSLSAALPRYFESFLTFTKSQNLFMEEPFFQKYVGQ